MKRQSISRAKTIKLSGQNRHKSSRLSIGNSFLDMVSKTSNNNDKKISSKLKAFVL